jgi:ABC-2 type transport system permease protein
MTSITARARSSSATSWPRPRVLVALLQRDYRVRRSYRLAIAFDFAVGIVDVIVYYFISKTFKGATSASLGGAPSYFAFALVGIVVTAIIQATASGVGFKIREEQLTGTLEALVGQPVTPSEMALGMCGLPFLMATARVAVYLTVGALLLGLNLSHTDWVGFLVTLIVTGGVMSALGIATSAFVIVSKRGNTLAGLALFAMGMLGGAVFPVEVLPPILQAIGEVVPTKFAFDALRHALYVGTGWEGDAAVLAAISIVALPLAVWAFGRALRHARRAGTLSQY